MNFNADRAIYLQMADRLCDDILAGAYKEEDRVPSVREYAVMLQVNINTAVKAYDALARDEIIYKSRGLGYFVSPGARQTILQQRKQTFMTRKLPDLFKEMRLLGLTFDDLREAWQQAEGQTT